MTASQAYGEDGVIRTVDILKREIVTGMRLLGVQNVNQLAPEMVSTNFQPRSLSVPQEARADTAARAQVENVNWQPLVARL